jgi:hypothetical protein
MKNTLHIIDSHQINYRDKKLLGMCCEVTLGRYFTKIEQNGLYRIISDLQKNLR